LNLWPLPVSGKIREPLTSSACYLPALFTVCKCPEASQTAYAMAISILNLAITWSEVLDADLLGDPQPRHPGRADGRLRRAEGPARRGKRRLGEDDRANMHRASSAELIQVRAEKGLGGNRERPEACLHRSLRNRRAGPVRRLLRQWEKRYPAIIRLWENAWAEFVPFLRFHQEIRTVICTTNVGVDQRPAAPGRERPQSFPDRAAGHEVPVPGDHESRPDREGPQALDQPVEGRLERLRHNL
jgi:hypothetical protein